MSHRRGSLSYLIVCDKELPLLMRRFWVSIPVLIRLNSMLSTLCCVASRTHLEAFSVSAANPLTVPHPIISVSRNSSIAVAHTITSVHSVPLLTVSFIFYLLKRLLNRSSCYSLVNCTCYSFLLGCESA